MAIQKTEAVVDETGHIPSFAVNLPANTRVCITVVPIEGENKGATDEQSSAPAKTGKAYGFFEFIKNHPIDGLPPDLSENLDEYLYGGKKLEDGSDLS